MSWNSDYLSRDFDEDNDEANDEMLAEETKFKMEQQRDCLVYLIDASPPMHHVPVQDSGDGASPMSPFRSCVAAAAAQYKNRIINDHRDRVAIVFYGVQKESNVLGHPSVHVFHDLDEPSAARITQLEKLAESPTLFESQIGTSDNYALDQAFWVVNSLFSRSAKKDDHKRVFLMTNTSHPHQRDPELQKIAITRAKDLHDIGAVIYLFGLDKVGGFSPHGNSASFGSQESSGTIPFDFDAFYKDNILFKSDADDDGLVENNDDENRYFNASGGLETLTQKVEQKVFKKRSVFKCSLILGDGLEVGVRGFNLVSEVKPNASTYLLEATNEEVAVVTSYVCKTTAQQLSASDMDIYYPYGGAKAIFTKEEIAEIKDLGEPGIRLLGFKPIIQVTRKPYYNLKHSVFIVPDEEAFTGSCSLFIQLLARMYQKSKSAICSYIPKKGSSPRVVALLPQLEEYDERGNVVKPSGFHLLHIPFNDDLRKPPAPSFDAVKRIPELQAAVKIMNDIVDKITVKGFSVWNYPNPTLAKHYANLQAVALKKDAADDIVDPTLPNNEAIQKRIAKFVPELISAIPLPEETEETSVASKKRKAAASPTAPKVKKEKADSVDKDVVVNAHLEGKLHKLTVPILTSYLKSVGVAPEKRKDGLVRQVEVFLGTRVKDEAE